MTFNDYNDKSKVTDRVLPLEYYVLGLCGEAGEVSEKVKKSIRGDYIIDAKMSIEIAKELGDVLWYLCAISRKLGIDFDTIAENNITKLLDRLQRNKIVGNGDNR